MRLFAYVLTVGFLAASTPSTVFSQSEKQIKDLQTEMNALRLELAYLKGKIETIERLLAQRTSSPQQAQPVSPQPTEQPALPEKKSKTSGATEQSQSSPKQQSVIQQTATRCQAVTKKGTQCSRNAKPGSNYCWQHGG